MYLFKRKKDENKLIITINEIILGSNYELVLLKKDYKLFGNIIVKFVSSGKKDLKFIMDRDEIIFNGKCYGESDFVIFKSTNREERLIEFIRLVFDIIKSDDWRLTGQDGYLLFAQLKEVIPSEHLSKLDDPKLFHEHCEFCMDKIEEQPNKKCYCTMNNYRWICEEDFDDFKDMFKFKLKG